MNSLTFSDLNLKLAIPYNHDLEIIKLIDRYKPHIASLYLPVPPRLMFSGDVTQAINWKKYEEEEIPYLHKTLSPWGIQLSLLLNVTTVFSPKIFQSFTRSDIYAYVKNLISQGITHFVVADIALAIALRNEFKKDIALEVSLNAFINTIKKAIHWIDAIDPEIICIAEDMNKNLEWIKTLKQVTNKPLKMLVNSRCQADCPNALCHANLLSGGYASSYYMCGTQIAKKPWFAYRANAVVPYNLRYYQGLINYIKLIGRTQPTYIIERDLELYVDNCNSRSYSLNNGVINAAYGHYDDLGEYITRHIKHPFLKEEPADVFQKVTTCQRNCQICHWCFERWKKDWNIKEEIDPVKGIQYLYKDLF